MKRTTKKILALLLTLSLLFALGACGSNGSGSNENNSGSNSGTSQGTDSNENDSGSNSDTSQGADSNVTVEPKAVKIGVALYQDTGAAVDAVKAYLDALSGPLNVTFTYTVLTMTDESANLTKIQELIAAGVDGIICTMDLGIPAILDECEAANVYLAGFLCDYDTSYNTTYDQVFKHEYFLGTVADGNTPDQFTAGYDFFDSLIEYNERNPEDPITHVSMAMFPAWAYPTSPISVAQFEETVEAYNAEHPDSAITVDPLDEDGDVLMFAPLDSTYFSKHPGIQAIMSFAAGSFVYPTMVSAGVDSDIKLFASGFTEGDEANFGTAGTGTYQLECVSAVEAINYPLVLLLNKLNGVEFSDMPAEAERVTCSVILINSDEDMAKFQGSLYMTGDVAGAFFTPEEVLNMTAFANPNATYAGLVDSLHHMAIEDID